MRKKGKFTRKLKFKGFYYFLKRKKKGLTAYFTLLGFLLLLYWLIRGDQLTINNIKCSRDGKECSEQITAELEKIKDARILTFRSKDLEDKLLQADPSIKKVKVKILIPDTIELLLESKIPFLAIKTENSKLAYLVDEQGYIYALTEDYLSVLSTLYLNNVNLEIGKQIQNPEILAGIRLAKILQEQYLPFQSLKVDHLKITIDLNNGSHALFASDADLHKQVTSLQQILSQATIETKQQLIDLRFDKPVISEL